SARLIFFFSSRRRHTRSYGDWSSDVCSSDLNMHQLQEVAQVRLRLVVTLQLLDGQLEFKAVGAGTVRAVGPIGSIRAVVLRLRRSEERRVGKAWGWRVAAEYTISDAKSVEGG